jgi:hypothetical protein
MMDFLRRINLDREVAGKLVQMRHNYIIGIMDVIVKVTVVVIFPGVVIHNDSVSQYS